LIGQVAASLFYGETLYKLVVDSLALNRVAAQSRPGVRRDSWAACPGSSADAGPAKRSVRPAAMKMRGFIELPSEIMM